MRRPETALLAVLGVAVLVTGVVLDQAELVAGGPGLLAVGVLLSVLQDFKLGAFSATFRPEQREFEFADFVAAQAASMGRLAADLGAGRQAAAVAEDAFADSAVHWPDGLDAFRTHVICHIVHRVLGGDRQGERYRRALDVLRARGLDEATIAVVTGVPVARVRADMAS